MGVPELSGAARADALMKAATARKERAELRHKLKAGQITFAAVMAMGEGENANPIAARMKVIALIESLPGYGKAKAERLMGDLDISPSRRIQGLGARQRVQLMERLG